MLLPRAIARLGPRELLVNEVFVSLQGESTHVGRPCLFVRLTGCHLRCEWCDSEYAFHDGTILTLEDCLNRAKESGQTLVEVTGGEPLLQKPVYTLLKELCDHGYEVLLETSGAIPLDRVDRRVHCIVDWKCPGSRMSHRNSASVIGTLKPGDELKLVILNRTDYEWARHWIQSVLPGLPRGVAVHFSPVTGRLSPRLLAEWILEDRLPVRLGLQLHKQLWGDRRGV